MGKRCEEERPVRLISESGPWATFHGRRNRSSKDIWDRGSRVLAKMVERSDSAESSSPLLL